MPRGYRCIIVAFVGWLSLAAVQPKQAADQPDKATQNEVSASLRNISAALQDANKPSGHDKPCNQGSDDRSSDLCAQWKAADAADSSAHATWVFGYIGTLIGLLTLGAAGAAAWYAKLAAEHTEKGANEARRAADAAEEDVQNARHSARPYFRSEQEVVTFDDESRAVLLHLILRNTGTTPAHGLVGDFDTSFRYDGGRVILVAPFYFDSGTVEPNATIDLPFDIPLAEAEATALREGKGRLTVMLSMKYLTAFGERWIYEQRFGVGKASLDSGIAITEDCQNRRDDETEEANNQPALDLGGGR